MRTIGVPTLTALTMALSVAGIAGQAKAEPRSNASVYHDPAAWRQPIPPITGGGKKKSIGKIQKENGAASPTLWQRVN